MTLPAGFLGTRADILLDLVIVSLVVVVPVLVYSWLKVRQQRYALHKVLQLTLLIVLANASTRRFWGRLGMVLMTLTGLTSLPVYIYGFAL